MGLTTFRVPLEEMGRLAIENVLENGGDREFLLEGKLVLRKSCGCKEVKDE